MAYKDFDFMGFTYNGKHSFRDLGIYRTIEGDRYEDALTPTFQEKTAEVDGMVGMYYFGQKISQKQFNISFAFDNLTEEKIKLLKKAFNGDGIHDLIFDEYPYKVYSAKITSSATIKHICFDSESGRIYKGEGSLTFVCYYPYAHSPRTIWDNKEESIPTIKTFTINYQKDIEEEISYLTGSVKQIDLLCGIITSGECKFTIPYNQTSLIDKLVVHYYQNGKKQKKETASFSSAEYTIDFGSKETYIENIEYIYKQKIEEVLDSMTTIFTPKITTASIQYIYSIMHGDDECYRRADGTGAMQKPSSKIINDYSAFYYPTKREWYSSSGMSLHTINSTNIGDVDAPFKVEYRPIGPFAENTLITLTVGSEENKKEISFYAKEETTYTWDSKIGVVSKLVEGEMKPIASSGEACCLIKPGEEFTLSCNDEAEHVKRITYDYWYY